jgi:hypothetical protein
MAFAATPLIPTGFFAGISGGGPPRRRFIECDNYIGPDRRFKDLGPPVGIEGRREEDARDASAVESMEVETEEQEKRAAG